MLAYSTQKTIDFAIVDNLYNHCGRPPSWADAAKRALSVQHLSAFFPRQVLMNSKTYL